MRILFLVLCLFIGSAFADSINIQQFRFTQNHKFSSIEDALLDSERTSAYHKFIFTSSLSFVDDPLTIENSSNDKKVDVVVDYFYTLNFGGAWRFSKNLELGFSSSYSYLKRREQDQDLLNQDFVNKTSLEDTTLQLKWRFYQSKKTAWALIPRLELPTGQSENYLSNDSVSPGLDIAWEKLFEKLRIGVNLGYRSAPKGVYKYVLTSGSSENEVSFQERVLLGMGMTYSFNQKSALNLEWNRLWGLPLGDSYNPNEFVASYKHSFRPLLTGFLFASLGDIEPNSDSNDIRIGLGIKYSPSNEKLYHLNVLRGSGSGKYAAGERVLITANKYKKNIKFRRWKSSVHSVLESKSKSETYITMPARDVKIKAYFSKIKGLPTYQVTVVGGSGSGKYLEGEEVSIEAITNVSEKFKTWTGLPNSFKGEAEQNKIVFVMPKNNLKIIAVNTPKVVRFNTKIYFATGSFSLNTKSKQELDKLIAYYKESSESDKKIKKIVVDGFTSKSGSFSFNLKLSKNRAAAALQYLVNKGIPKKLMEQYYHGENKLDTKTKSSKSDLWKNRRVEFTIYQ